MLSAARVPCVIAASLCWATTVSATVPPLAQRLATAAERAVAEGRFRAAASLLRGAWTISQDMSLLSQLGQVNSMAGQFEEAIESYELLVKRAPSGEAVKKARAEIARLRSAPLPFSDELTTRFQATAEARECFKSGLQLARRANYNEGVRYLRAALVLDPTLPGTYRVLGGIYSKLKDTAKEREFLLEYLRLRPDGKIADDIRRQLASQLGSVDITASFPCKIWINGRPLGRSTPVKGILLPPGRHTVSFVSAEYHIIRNSRLETKVREKTQVAFDFGMLTVKLTPWARARVNGKDLGLWETVGLPAGEYALSLVAHDGSRQKQLVVTIGASKNVSIEKW